jgi:predicted TPR repeat methyltransferase
MPYSLPSGKAQTAEWFNNNQDSVNRVLDIGAGAVTYPKLIKQEHSICQTAEWVGIEAWEPYIEQFDLKSLYDQVVNCDARKLNWTSLGQFDVAIAGDVLEHMTKEEAVVLVNEILKNCKTLIISIPIRYMPQDDIEGNPFEIHVKPDWTHNEVVATWGNQIKDYWRKSVKSKIGVYWLANA